MPCLDTWRWVPRRGDSMECPDCGERNESPAATTILLDTVFDDSHPDVEAGAQEHLQLECPDCGAILGYQGSAAAFGSTDVRGFY